MGKKKEKLKKLCCSCGQLKVKCVWTYDPFKEEVYGIDPNVDKKDWWCPNCYAEAVMDT